MTENELATVVIGEAIHVHRTLGPGLLEKVYVECLTYRLKSRGLMIELEKPIPVIFENTKLDCGFRADIIVEGKLLIEVKAIDLIADIHKAITLTYLTFSNHKLGLLINFNVKLLKDGIKRIVNGL